MGEINLNLINSSKLFILLLLFSLYSANICPQNIDGVKSFKTLSRLKLSGGYFLGEKSIIGGNSWFANFNYRASLLNKYGENFEIAPAVEGGINISNWFFPLYIKAGPEVKIIKNIMAGAAIGYVGILVYPTPFYGFNAFILNNLSENIYLELEGGFHFSFLDKNIPIFYLSAGISFN